MPNGHGAVPRFGSPLLILLVTFLLLWWARSQAALLPQVLAVVAAGIFGWRLAFHMTMWNVSEYDGRYSSEEQVANSKRRYRVALFTLIPLFVLLTLILITARPAHSETVTLEELRNAGLQGLPAEGSSKSRLPDPSGTGIHDPRLTGKDIRSLDSGEDYAVRMLYAIGDDDVEEAQSLLVQGGDPNVKVPGSDMNILMTAQSAAMVKLLLDHGADPNLPDKDGATSLHYLLTATSAPEIVPILLSSGANVNKAAEGRGGRTPLHEAVQWYFEGRDHAVGDRLIRLLVSSGADINAPGYHGKTVLHQAVENDKPDLLRLALELGADPSVRDADGATALDMARSLKRDALVEMLSSPVTVSWRGNRCG
ncbi:MAG TPA: ankyrin repeat domain-containing protein [Syntrophales bacterium]|nr:ankyrin repeat domain-containing protein [Syntrophales bacterium]